MTDQEKAALLQFIGVTHAQAKQTDQMIVNQSQYLRPVSNSFEQQFAQVLSTPTMPDQFQPQQFQPQQVQPQAEYIPEPVQSNEHQLELQFTAPAPAQVVHPMQVGNVDEIIKELKEINLNLVNVVAILKESNVKAKTKNTIKG